MRCHHFLSFSNEETLAQGVHDFLKASQQTSGRTRIWTLSPQAQHACSLWPLCSPPSWKKTHASQNNTYTSSPGCLQICAISLLSPTACHNPPCGFPFFFFFWSFCHFLDRSCGMWVEHGAVATSLRQSHSNAWFEPCLHPTPQLRATGLLTNWARAGIEPETSWFLVGFVNHCATTGTPWSSWL